MKTKQEKKNVKTISVTIKALIQLVLWIGVFYFLYKDEHFKYITLLLCISIGRTLKVMSQNRKIIKKLKKYKQVN